MSRDPDLVPVKVATNTTVIDNGKRLREGDRLDVPMRLLAPMLTAGYVTLLDMYGAS
jgi:hypothetical protein